MHFNGNKKFRTVAETLSYTWSPSAAHRDNPKREDPHPRGGYLGLPPQFRPETGLKAPFSRIVAGVVYLSALVLSCVKSP